MLESIRYATAWLNAGRAYKKALSQDRETFEAERLRRFRKFAKFAIESSRYYAEIASSRRINPSKCFPADFPVLTRDVLQKRYDDILTPADLCHQQIADFLAVDDDPCSDFRNKYVLVHSSGTTGKNVWVPFTRAEWLHGVCRATRYWGKPKWGQRTVYLGVTEGRHAGVAISRRSRNLITRWFNRCRNIHVNTPVKSMVDQLNRFQPHALQGYAGTIFLMAIEQRAGRLKIGKPSWILIGGEVVSPRCQAVIREVFDCPVIDVYASTEHLLMGANSKSDSRMRLFEDDLMFECHDGHLCVTNLFNRTLPLIRYRMEDSLQLHRNQFVGPYQVVEEILGRKEAPVVLKNRLGQKEVIHAIDFAGAEFPALLQFQVHVPATMDELVVHAVFEKDLSSNEKSQTFSDISACFREILVRKGVEEIPVRVLETDCIRPDPKTGKIRMVHSAARYESIVD